VLHIAEVLAEGQIVINCSGLGARSLGGVEDEAVTPVRGQTILVRLKNAPAFDEFASMRETGNPCSFLPRGDGLYILNGTYEVGEWSRRPLPMTAEAIWSRCERLRPSWLAGAEVVSHQVGLRPSRKGGPRIELQQLPLSQVVVHNYGHGGDGVVLSWGSARDVLALLEEAKGRQQQPATSAATRARL